MKAAHPTPQPEPPADPAEVPILDCPFTIEWGYVRPTLAAEWLAQAAPNRKFKQESIDGFARDMLTGRWFPNHQGVAFRPDGKLFDGQNRLSAIVQSGRGQWMLVCRYKTLEIAGIASTPMETFDRGVARSVADVLGLEHGMAEEGKAVAAALLHLARLCVKWPRFQAHKSTVPQAVAVLGIFRPQLEWLVKVRTRVHGLRRVELIGTLALAHALLPEAVAEFYEQVVAGDGATWSAARVLHEALVVERPDFCETHDAATRQRSGGVVLACLRAHVAGEKLLKLPIEHGPAALGWFQEQLREKVVACAALFPMVREEPRSVGKRMKISKAAREPEPVRATRTFTQAPKGEGDATPAPVVERVTKAVDLRMTPAAAKLLAAAGGGR